MTVSVVLIMRTAEYYREKMKSEQKEERSRTRKIFSQERNALVIEYMNTVLEKEKIDEELIDIKALNDLIYACQLTYEEITQKTKKENKWREAIEKKISRFEDQLRTILKHSQVETPREIGRAHV